MQQRALREEELEAWFAHVDEVFTRTPRAYFERHFRNDPWCSLEGVRVAVDTDRHDRIASTLRVFVRRVLVGGKSLSCGGIGEVSTKDEYRNRGLATKLLKDAVEWMKESNMVLSMLHTRSAAPLYKSLGWTSVPLHCLVVRTSLASLLGYAGSKFAHKMIDVKNPTQLHRVADIHVAYSKHFNGTFVRDHQDYWTKWIGYEFTREDSYSALAVPEDRESEPVAYLSCFIRRSADQVETPHAIEVRVREFGAQDSQFAEDGGLAVLLSTVHYLVNQYLQVTALDKEAQLITSISLTYPAAIANYFTANVLEALSSPATASISQTEDAGMMIRAIDASIPENELERILRQRPGAGGNSGEDAYGDYFLFWETDSF